MTEDIPLIRGDIPRLMEELRLIRSEHTALVYLYALGNSSTMVVYHNGFRPSEHVEAFGLVVVDQGGNSLLNGPVTFGSDSESGVRFFPYTAKDNLVFSIRPAEQLPDGDWGNPGVDVWRFVPAASGG